MRRETEMKSDRDEEIEREMRRETEMKRDRGEEIKMRREINMR